MILTIIKFICLFVGIWLSIVDVGRIKCKQDVLDLLSKEEELPKDFEWAFCFSDSY